jgi:2-oxoglutarate ferredoxin oxidoreductase subunit gamma
MEKIGKPIVFNICMLGALIELTGLVKPDSILAVLKEKIGPDFMTMNQESLGTGIQLARAI